MTVTLRPAAQSGTHTHTHFLIECRLLVIFYLGSVILHANYIAKVLFLGTRMRALHMDPVNGNPQRCAFGFACGALVGFAYTYYTRTSHVTRCIACYVFENIANR